MKYAYQLNIPTTNALKVDLHKFFLDKQDRDVIRKKSGGIIPVSAYPTKIDEIFNTEWIEKAQMLLPDGVMFIPELIVFFRDHHGINNIHVDIMPSTPPIIPIFGLNFITTDENDSEMVWFKKIDGTNPNINNASLPNDRIYEVARERISKDQLTLVNTSEYHSIDNSGCPRWCVSLRTNEAFSSWSEVVQAFDKLILK